MEQTVAKQRRSQSLIDRDIKAYELHMNGLSIRAIGDDIGLKSSRSAWDSVNRGKKYVQENGINIECRTIEIDQLFKNTLGHLAAEIARQANEGRIVEIERNDGSKEIRRTRGIDPRTAEALARSADRWAQFLGITDRATEVNQQATVIQLSAPTDAAAFADKWNSTETVNITPSESKSESTGELLLSDTSPELHRPTASKAVDAPQRSQKELF